jgi:hypothetical protein
VSLGRDVVVLACAISTGVHAALVSAHGASFVAAGAAFAVVAAWLTLRPESALPLAAAALALAGSLAAYGAAVTTGLPLVHPDPEPVEGLALATKALEAAGLAAAVGSRRAPAAGPVPIGLVGLVATFSALAALALSGAHGTHAAAEPVRTGAGATPISR